MIDWTGVGWRLWAVEGRGAGARLRSPWTSTARATWHRGEVHVAECVWRNRDGSSACLGLVSVSCTCGIRSMASLPDLAGWLADGRQLDGDEATPLVVGRVRIGGRVQHRVGALEPHRGYQRSELAQIDGPLFVSPAAAEYEEAVAAGYGSARSQVFGPDLITGAHGQQDWLEKLAVRAASLRSSAERTAGRSGSASAGDLGEGRAHVGEVDEGRDRERQVDQVDGRGVEQQHLREQAEAQDDAPRRLAQLAGGYVGLGGVEQRADERERLERQHRQHDDEVDVSLELVEGHGPRVVQARRRPAGLDSALDTALDLAVASRRERLLSTSCSDSKP